MFFHQNHYKETFDIQDINHLQNIIYQLNFSTYKSVFYIYDALRNLVPFVQSKKLEDTDGEVAKSLQLY